MDKDAKDEFDLPDDADAGAADDSTADDDWAAARAGPSQADTTPNASASASEKAANIFPSFDEPGNKASLMNELEDVYKSQAPTWWQAWTRGASSWAPWWPTS